MKRAARGEVGRGAGHGRATRRRATALSDRAVRDLTWRELVRAVQVVAVAARHLLPGLLRRTNRSAEWCAPRLRRMVVELGPPFVKLSQVVASSPGLFPVPISNALRDLLDDAPPEPWEAIRRALEDGLGAPVGERFLSVDTEPLAAASIAQVHAAELPDGTRVVVKVRRPDVESQFLRDLRLLRRLAGLAQRWSAARVLNPVGIVDDTVATLCREFDFGVEADAMERFGRNLRQFGDNHRIRVPAVHHGWCGDGVLTMERVDGIKIDDLLAVGAAGVDARALLRAGVRAWIEAACEFGFFHGDVHAGNLLLDTEGRAVFLDFGIMGELDDRTRLLVRRGVVALLHERDFDVVVDCLVQLGAHFGYAGDAGRAAAAIRRIAEPLMAKPLAELDYLAVLNDVVRKAAPHGVQLPQSLVLLFKQIIYFERYAKLLAPDWDILSDTFLIEFMLGPDEGAEPPLVAP